MPKPQTEISDMKQNRKNELSFMNVICCMAVIFIHVNSEAVLSLDKKSVWFALLYTAWQAASFVVYGFIFLSGIKQFLEKNKNIDYFEYYKKRLVKIVLPYILWLLIYYAYDCINNIEVFNFKNLIYYLYSGDYIGHFYFVAVIVQFYLLMPLWKKLFSKVSPHIMIPLSLIFTVAIGQNLANIIGIFKPNYNFRLSSNVFIPYLFYWTAGAYVGINYEKASKIFKSCKKFIFIAFLFVSIFSLSAAYYSSVSEKYFSWLEDVMTMYRISAVIFIFTLAFGKASKICKYRFFKYIDMSSYNIYLCHCLVLKIVNQYLQKFAVSGLKYRYIIRFAAVYIISVGLCAAYSAVKNRLQKSINSEKI